MRRFFSQGTKLRLTLTFDNQQYRGEDIVFAGDKFSVAYAGTHSYSPLGQFLHTYNSIIKEGLLGSALSTAWPLLDPSTKGAKISYTGLENVGEAKLHRVEYPSGTSVRSIRSASPPRSTAASGTRARPRPTTV